MKGIILSTVLLVSVVGGSEQTCARSWTQLGNSCYVILDETGTWIEAGDYCKAVGGDLAEVDSADENRFLTNFMNNRGADGAWIGLNDLVEEGQFMWTRTQRAASYTNWGPGQPDNLNNQDCVWLTNRSGFIRGTWDDLQCSARLRFICERSSQ